MNRIYQSIWNDKTGTFVAASENAKGGGRTSSSGASALAGCARFALKGLAVSLMLAFGSNAYAEPTGGVVSAGSASITGSAGSTTINQASQNAAINWQGFSIGQGEAVRFVQPNSSSVALNRVLGADPSNILGSLSANGKVFLVNPNGILFGQGAQVNVGGLVASTLNISDADFMAGKYNFSGTSNATVLNQGSINADGGYVALLGANVSNEGVITAKLGTVTLAAGNAVTLDVAGDGLLNVTVNQGAMNALAQNGGLIQADGGQVLLTAQSAGNLLQSAVNNTGVIQAQTIENHNGTIRLMGDIQSGTVNVSGKLDASAPNGGDGGFIETSAARVNVTDNAIVSAQSAQSKSGTWLIDPNDVTIQTAGAETNVTASPNFTSTNDNAIVTTASIQTALNAGTSVVVTTGAGGTNAQLGDITVTGTITYNAPTAATTLTLNATQDVIVNAAITATTGSFAATAGRDVRINAATKTTTGNLTLTAVRDAYLAAATTVITGNLTAVAGGNVNVSAASTITTGDMVFRGDNDGTGPGATAGTVAITCGSNCLTITTGNLKIRFNPNGYANTATEITAYDANLTGAGVLDAKAWVFGLGDNKIYDGTRTAIVSGFKPDISAAVPVVTGTLGAITTPLFDTKHVGTSKLITYGSTFTDPVYELFAPFGTAGGTYTTRADIFVRPLTVSAVTDTRVYNGTTSSVGVPTVTGLQVGDVPVDTLNGTLTQAYASKNVMGTGGSTLVATGPYTVTDGNGGNNYTITVNTAPGTITPATLVGSITAANKQYDGNTTATISTRTLATPIGGDTVGYVGGTALFSDKNVADGKTVTGTGLSLAGADAANYTVNTTATTTANITPAPLTIQANNNTKVYGTTFTPAATAFTVPVPPIAGESVTSVTETSPAGTAATAAVPGPYPITPSGAVGAGGFLAGNYTIKYVDGALTVTPAALKVTANNNTKVYGTTFTPVSTAFTTTALQNGETVASVSDVSTAGTPPTAAVPGPYAITPSAAIGGTFTPSNYTITYVDGALTVTPVPLAVTASNVTKVFGETPTLSAFTTAGLVNSETVASVTETSTGTVATAAVPGPYAITPSAATGGTFTPSNYTITYVDGALLVTPAPMPPIVVPPVVVVPPVAPPVVVVPPVVIVPPVVVVPPGVVAPPVVVVSPDVVAPPVAGVPPGVVTPPVAGVPPAVVTPPDVAAPPLATESTTTPEVPQLELASGIVPFQDNLNLNVVGTGVRMPPSMFAYTPPVQRVAILVPPPSPQVQPPPAFVPRAAPPPPAYVPPRLPPKQDRN